MQKFSLNENIKGYLAEYSFLTKQEFRINHMGSGYTLYPVSNKGSTYSIEQAIMMNFAVSRIIKTEKDVIFIIGTSERIKQQHL